MASLQERNGSYRVLLFYHGKLHRTSIICSSFCLIIGKTPI